MCACLHMFENVNGLVIMVAQICWPREGQGYYAYIHYINDIQTWLMGVFFIRGIHYNLCFNLCLYQYFACKCQTLNLTLWNIRASLVNIKHWTILIIHDLTLHMINIISFCIFSVHLTSISLNQAITIVTIIIQINNIVWGCG